MGMCRGFALGLSLSKLDRAGRMDEATGTGRISFPESALPRLRC